MWFELTYTALGGLGMFFFGMKILSESLQALSGDLVRRVIGLATKNRLMAVVVGIVISALVQSSTLTTVMVMGLVNAELLKLSQAIAVIFGANIGTTATAWLVAIRVGQYGLVFIGLGAVPMLLAKNRVVRQIGYLIVALGMLYLGMQYMISAFKPLHNSPGFAEIAAHFRADSIRSLAACVVAGAVLSTLVHSSAAVVAVSMAIGIAGNITFATATAFMLGAEIGTTLTTLMASTGTSTNAKRAARAHAVFNIVGVALMTVFFWIFVDAMDFIVYGDPDAFNSFGERPYMAAHIAAAQTAFNVVSTIVFLPFLQTLERCVVWLTPGPASKETPHLKYLTATIDLEAPGLGLEMAKRELINLADVASRAVNAIERLINAKVFEQEIFDKIQHYEQVTDAIQKEITVFLCRIQQARLTPDQSTVAYALIRASDELESVADYCASLARARARLKDSNESFTEVAADSVRLYATGVADNYRALYETLRDGRPLDRGHFEQEEQRLVRDGDRLREVHRQRIASGECTPIAGMVFTDLVVGLRKLKGHTLEVVKALSAAPEAS